MGFKLRSSWLNHNILWTESLRLVGKVVVQMVFSWDLCFKWKETLTSVWSSWDQTNNLWHHETSLLSVSHRSHVSPCAGTFILLSTCDFIINYPVNMIIHSVIWIQVSITMLYSKSKCLSTCPSELSHVWVTLWDVMRTIWTLHTMIKTQQFITWATGVDEYFNGFLLRAWL